MASLVCLPLISGCAPKPEPVSVAAHIWPGYEPIFLASETGWLDQQQIKLAQTTSATDTVKLIEEGKVDAAGLTLDEAHADALRHLLAAHLKAVKRLNINPEDAAYRMAPRFKLQHDQVMATFKDLVLPDMNNNIRLLDTAAPTMTKSARIIADTMLQAGVLHQQANLNGLLHPKYLPRADR